jgi:hypothetical protein
MFVGIKISLLQSGLFKNSWNRQNNGQFYYEIGTISHENSAVPYSYAGSEVLNGSYRRFGETSVHIKATQRCIQDVNILVPYNCPATADLNLMTTELN